MKKHGLLCALLFSLLMNSAYAGGGRTHILMAEEAIAKLPDKKLRNLLMDNLDAYLVGAYYPDSGYTDASNHGDLSHSREFHYAFADLLRDKYKDPINENPKLVAFMLGTVAHAAGDDQLHYVFYPEAAKHDFNGDDATTHLYGDVGIDLLVTVDKIRWTSAPIDWWVPVSDLMQVYHRLGHDEYTRNELIESSKIISIAGLEENLIALPAYPYLLWKMSWMATNYYQSPQGGLLVAEDKIASSEMELWSYLQSKQHSLSKAKVKVNAYVVSGEDPVRNFGNKILRAGAIFVKVDENADGSVNFERPIIEDNKAVLVFANNILDWLRQR